MELWRSLLGPVRRGRNCQHFAKFPNIQQASGLGRVRPQHCRSRINVPTSSLGHFYTPKCPKTFPISHQDFPQTHRDPPQTSARPWKTPPKTSPRHHLEFSNITAWCFSGKQKRFSYVRCSRRTSFEASEDSPKLFTGDLIPKTRLVPPRTPPEILPRSRTIQDCSETPQNLPRLPQDLPRFQDCRKTTQGLDPLETPRYGPSKHPPGFPPEPARSCHRDLAK